VRILLVANTLPPADLSGVGEQVVQLAQGLRERGHEVQILGRQRGGVRGPKVLFPLFAVPALRRAVREFRPDVVQVHESDVGLGAVSLPRSRRRRPLLVALLQVSYCEERRAIRPLRDRGAIVGRPGAAERRFRWFKAPLQILLGRWTARAADLVLAPSRTTAAEIARDYDVELPRVLPNATGGVTVEPRPLPLEVPVAEPPLLFVGRLRLRKGVEILLRALREMAREEPSARLLIAGEGEHRAALEDEARRLQLGERVRFLGRVDAGQVRTLLGLARALVVPSVYEGMPLVVLEAMEAGRPIVASRVSGIPEVVVDGETGWLVPAEDSQALATALVELYSDPAAAAGRGAAGRDRLEKCYRPARVAALWEDLVNGRLNSKGKG